MTIPEEIEQLKIKLQKTVDERDQAEILVEILRKHISVNSTDTQPHIEYLLQLAEKLNEPLYHAWGHQHLATLQRNKGEFETSLTSDGKALRLFEQIKSKQGIASSYNNIGLTYEQQGDYPEALKNYFISLKLRKETEDKLSVAASYNNIGNIYKRQGNFPEALKNHFASVKLRKEIGNTGGIADSYTNIGIVYKIQGNFEESLKNHFTSLKLSEEIGNKRSIAASYINIGGTYEAQGNYTEALENIFKALHIFQAIDHKLGVARSYSNIALIYYRQQNYTEALKYYFDSLALSEQIGDNPGISIFHNNIGNVYSKLGNYPEAFNHQLLALNKAAAIGYKEIIKESSLSLTSIYKAAGDFENALKYYENYHQVESEMIGEKAKGQLTHLNFHHNMEQKEKDLEIEQLRNVELKKERDRSENLLLNILPAEVAEELKAKGTADAKLFNDVTVLFTDFTDFTIISEKLSPQQLVDELHDCFSAFDKICEKYSIEKIKTVGDAYLAVSGLPLANPNHAGDMVNAALEINQFIAKRIKERESKALSFGEGLGEVRIGIHSGSVVAGIVGIKKFAYDIWGDTVNTAARMEQNSEAGKINISQTTYELLNRNSTSLRSGISPFTFEYRGEIEAKNKGKLKMYFVN
ncbi:MAG: tetratricopeptide repeat protein [Bacteroidetes bacterium]|nr:tetratricopeptide repeat protein [Bacteroidota bacterium]